MNPQSFNRYAYVLNNPTSMVDPSGLVNCQEFGQSDCDCPPDSVDCCDPFSGDPDCPIQGGGPIGGIGDGGGGSISSPPTPTPNCNLYGDPVQCNGIDFPSGAIAEGSDSFLPCVAGNQLTQLENYLLAQAAAALGTPVAAQNGHPIIGGSVNVNLAIPKNGLPESQAAITNSTPLDDPVFERGWHNEIRIDSPIPSVPAGAGTTIHILFNTGTINGVNVITNAKIHADIGDTEDVVGLVRHVAGDVILARIVAHHRGCAVKFGLF